MNTNDRDFDRFRDVVLSRTGIDLGQYKREQILRRLGGMVQRANVPSLADYAALLQRDPRSVQEFVDRLTINVSEAFRNPEKFQELREKVLPALLHGRVGLNLWSAGCANGGEPYSLAMLLRELTPGVRHRIQATDVDPRVVERAREGLFLPADVRSVPAPLLKSYFVPEGEQYRVREDVRRDVQFRVHNLLCDPFPSGIDLIACRNVVIYFSEEAKDRLYERFYGALRPGGVLFIGSTERINRYRETGFEQVAAFFYRRPAA